MCEKLVFLTVTKICKLTDTKHNSTMWGTCIL